MNPLLYINDRHIVTACEATYTLNVIFTPSGKVALSNVFTSSLPRQKEELWRIHAAQVYVLTSTGFIRECTAELYTILPVDTGWEMYITRELLSPETGTVACFLSDVGLLTNYGIGARILAPSLLQDDVVYTDIVYRLEERL